MNTQSRRGIEATALVCIVLVPILMQPVSTAPFEPIKVMLFQIATTAMLGVVVLASLLAHIRDQSRVQRRDSRRTAVLFASNPLLLPLVAYAVVSLLATGVSVDPRLSLWGTPDDPVGMFAMLTGCLFCILLAQALRTSQQIERVRKALIIGSVPVVVYGLAQYLGLDPLRWISDEASPVHSTLGRSNFLGAYLAMVIPFAVIPLLYLNQRLRQWRLWLLVTLQVLCLVLTVARGAWLALVVGLAASLALLAHRRHSWRLLASVVFLLAIGLLVAAMLTFIPFSFKSGNALTHVEGLSFSEVRTISMDQRLVLWQRVLTLIPSRWIMGYGPRTLVQVNAMHPWPEVGDYTALTLARDAHNLFLSQLVETGVLGLGTLLALLAAFFRVVWRAQAHLVDHRLQAMALATLTSAIVFVVQAQFNPSVIVHFVLFWTILALSGALYRLSLDPFNRPSAAGGHDTTTI